MCQKLTDMDISSIIKNGRHDPYMTDGYRSIRRGDLWDGVTVFDYCDCDFCKDKKEQKK